MLHPSYSDLMQVVNSEVEEGDAPVVSSRYSIVMATSKRARQIIDGCNPLVDCAKDAKPLSIAVAELKSGKVKILSESEKTDAVSEKMTTKAADDTEEAAIMETEEAAIMEADEEAAEAEAFSEET